MIIIKVDDLKSDAHGGVPERWQRFVDYIKEHKLHAGIGIICDSLEVDKPAYFNWIKQLQASGSFEIWFHGWDHAPHTENGVVANEFVNRTFALKRPLKS